MKVKYKYEEPFVNDYLEYTFEGDKIGVRMSLKGVEGGNVFDFSDTPDGKMVTAEIIDGRPVSTFIMDIPSSPFISVERVNGELYVHLVMWAELTEHIESDWFTPEDNEVPNELLPAKFGWRNENEVKQEELQQEKQAVHQEKKQIAEKLIMNRMVSDYILSTELSDEEKDMFTNLFDLWEPNIAYSRGDKLYYEGLAYEVIQAHTSQSDWLPSELPALYKLFYQTSTDDGTIVIPEWKQPLGGHDAYNTGDLVFHDGKTWESSVDGNVWEPSVYGWIEYAE